MPTLPAWLQETDSLPLLSAQAREDSLQDLDVVRSLGRPARILVAGVSSCTAAALATLPEVMEIHLADSEPAQVALTRVKLRLLATAPPAGRKAVLGHAGGIPARQRRERLARLLEELELAEDALGPLDLLARWGLDYAGRFERAWAALRAELSGHEIELRELLDVQDLPQQTRRTAPTTVLGRALDAASKRVLAPAHVAALTRSSADAPCARGMSRALIRALRGALERVPAAANPYLWQLLGGRHPPEIAAPWLDAPVPPRLPQINWSPLALREVLSEEGPGFDSIHLGDTLDRLEAAEAEATLAAAASRLLPGGALITRHLTPPTQPQASVLNWDRDYAERLAQQDRSPFTLGLRVGRPGA